MTKSGFVSVIGRPNVGKSTLLNRLLGEKISIISNKPQTTRDQIKMIYNDDESQIIFVDTPGMQNPRNKLGDYMLNISKESVVDADLILYIVDASPYIGARDTDIINFLKTLDLPVILAINKVDTVEKGKILELISLYKDLDFISEIIPFSASMGDNVSQLLNTIKEYLPQGPKYYPEDYITDKSERFIISEIIREKTLTNLREEVPHGIGVIVDSVKDSKDGNSFNIGATIYTERDSHKGIILGKGGSMIKKIRLEATEDLEKFLDKKVNLDLWVKVEKNWREKEDKLKNFGYK
ncbi:GTPase Era [Neofamilia massiliensis]|uniref:GTPase Era n=1 Tax=Neofamilia massiliensis TaxID=1673724 RepID=UPI0006BB5D31|nr:GTPase Era [Neofamilia massiliensis]